MIDDRDPVRWATAAIALFVGVLVCSVVMLVVTLGTDWNPGPRQVLLILLLLWFAHLVGEACLAEAESIISSQKGMEDSREDRQ